MKGELSWPWKEGGRQEVGGRDNWWVSYQLLLGWQQDGRQGLNQMYSHDLPTPDELQQPHTTPHLSQALSWCLGWNQPSPDCGGFAHPGCGGDPHVPHLGLCLDRAPCTPRLEPGKGSSLPSGGKFHPETLKASIGYQAAGEEGLAAKLLGGRL